MAKLFTTSKEFETLFSSYFGPLCNYVNGHLNNWEDSREIVQSVFTKIWNNRENLNVHTSAQSYLYQSCKNTMIDFIRKRAKLTEEAKSGYYENIESDNDSNAYKSMIIRKELIKAMSALKPKNREIFELNKIEGLTYKEISQYLNISERSVEDNISRALKILREELRNNENIF